MPTDEGWLYVAGVLDRCTRRCIGWAFGETLATTLPLAALDMALTQRQPPSGLVHHSDRGVQYASQDYTENNAWRSPKASWSPFANSALILS